MKIIQSPAKDKKRSTGSKPFSDESSRTRPPLAAKLTPRKEERKEARDTDAAHSGSDKQSRTYGVDKEYQEAVNRCELPSGKKRRRSELGVEAASDANRAPIIEVDPAKKEFNKVLERGVRLLSMREHSVKEMHEKLRAKTDNGQHVVEVIDILLDKGYLSNERFAEAYVRARAERGFGPVKIRSELKNKGISSALALEYLDENSAKWLDNAERQYQKKYGNGSIEDYKAWAKRARFLQSRGFTSDHIQCVVPQVKED